MIRIANFFKFSDFTADFDAELIRELQSSNPKTDFDDLLEIVRESPSGKIASCNA